MKIKPLENFALYGRLLLYIGERSRSGGKLCVLSLWRQVHKMSHIALRSISGHRWEGSGLQLRFIPRALNDIAEVLYLDRKEIAIKYSCKGSACHIS